MDLSDDLPPPRRPLFFPVVIAAVFLAIIGMSVGLVLGARAKQAAKDTATQQPQYPPPGVVTPTAEPCRTETQAQAQLAGAAGTVRIELLIRTATSAVWICADDNGRLFYHANRGGEEAVWVERKTALFLTDVSRSGDAYRAVAVDGDGRVTTFMVSSERLLILHKDGKEEEQPAVPQ